MIPSISSRERIDTGELLVNFSREANEPFLDCVSNAIEQDMVVAKAVLHRDERRATKIVSDHDVI